MRLLFSLLLLSAPLFAADNWPTFRGPTGDGVSTAKGVPTTFSEKENVRWKTPIHDKGWSSPVVWGDQVWLTTAKETGEELFAVCVNLKTGKIEHDLKLLTVKSPPNIKQYNSFASPTPVLEDGRGYFHFGTYGTVCLDLKTAKPIWEKAELQVDHWRGPASSPVIWGDSLFLTFDGHDKQFFACLDKIREAGMLNGATGAPRGNSEVAAHRKAAGDAGDLEPERGEQPTEVHGGGLALDVGVGAEDDLLHLLGDHAGKQLLDPELIRADALDGVDGPLEHVVAPAELAGLLHRHHWNRLLQQGIHRLYGRFIMSPGNMFMGAQRSLLQLGMGRPTCQARQVNMGDPRSIGCAENGAHILGASHIIQDDVYLGSFRRHGGPF